MELYARVRRAVLVEGMSRRSAAREFGLARKTVRKMLEFSSPPGYQRQQPARRPKLGPWQGVIDAILEDDKRRPPKQRHTAKRIFERLRAEHGYTGGYTIVKDYVRDKKLGGPTSLAPPYRADRRQVHGTTGWPLRGRAVRPAAERKMPEAQTAAGSIAREPH